MWRVKYALYGRSSTGCVFDSNATPIYDTTRVSCSHASLIVGAESGLNHTLDACLISASTLPDGKILALHIDEERAELREARWSASNSPFCCVNGEEAKVSLIPVENVTDVSYDDAITNRSLVYLHATKWRTVDSALVVLDENDEPLQRLRRYNDFEPTVSILAADTVYQLHLEPLEKTNSFAFGRTSVNATAMDCWGPHAVVVGFSSGDVHVVDWRDPSRGPLLCTCAPQPPAKCPTVRRRRGAALPNAGIMSCCAMEDNFRVVCGLGDYCGTVVVTDLRRAVTASSLSRKRSRHSLANSALQAIVDGSFSTPTSYPVCDMRHCRHTFGTIGMVDTGGSSVLTTIGELEAGLVNTKRTQSKTNKDFFPTSTTSVSNVSSGDTAVAHTRSLRCDVSTDGGLLVSTSLAPLSAAITAPGQEQTDLKLNVAAQHTLGRDPFSSVSFTGSVFCAHTSNGNAFCAALCAY